MDSSLELVRLKAVMLSFLYISRPWEGPPVINGVTGALSCMGSLAPQLPPSCFLLNILLINP